MYFRKHWHCRELLLLSTKEECLETTVLLALVRIFLSPRATIISTVNFIRKVHGLLTDNYDNRAATTNHEDDGVDRDGRDEGD